MYSPTNQFPRRGVQGANNNSPMIPPTSQMFTPRNNSSQDFNSPRNSTTQSMYSPRNNTFQGMYSPMNTSSPPMYSPQNSPLPMNSSITASQNMYSPRNSSQDMHSPRNTPQGMYNQRPNIFRKSFNRSRNSSDFNSSYQSFSSNESFSPRRMPYYRRNRQSIHTEKRYNIQDYINPSMLENPWADLEAEIAYKKSLGRQS